MTNIVPCMGGFCSKRDGCAHYHSTAKINPSERLCGPGKDEPETAKALGFTPMAIELDGGRIQLSPDSLARGHGGPFILTGCCETTVQGLANPMGTQ